MAAQAISRYRWMLVTRGALWLFVGGIIYMLPAVSMSSWVRLFGAVLLLDGIQNVVCAAGMGLGRESRWGGFAGIAIGMLAFWIRSITEAQLLLYLACWGILVGTTEIIAAIRLRKEAEGDFWFVLAGAVSMAFGLLLLARLGAGATPVLPLIGACATVFGLSLLVLAFGAHTHVRRAAQRAFGSSKIQGRSP